MTDDSNCWMTGTLKRAALVWAVLLAVFGSLVTLEAGKFYFPHYGEGNGLSTLWSITNYSNRSAAVTMRVFDQDGNTVSLPGIGSTQFLSLNPNETRVLKSSGASNPARSGYVEIETTNDAISAVSIFQFDSGLEASVLPVIPAKQWTVFVERNQHLDTGVAFYRPGNDPIHLRLFNENGGLVDSRDFSFSGNQIALFLSELFSGLPVNFSGSLEMDSEDAFAPVALRFGGGALSTVTVREAIPFEQLQLEKLIGVWFFEFLSLTNTYALTNLITIGGTLYMMGLDEFGDPVLAQWHDDLDSFLLVDTGVLIDEAFVFDFSETDRISGCRHSFIGEQLGDCFSLTGTRISQDTFDTFSPANTTNRTKIENSKKQEEAKTPKSLVLEARFRTTKEAVKRLKAALKTTFTGDWSGEVVGGGVHFWP